MIDYSIVFIYLAGVLVAGFYQSLKVKSVSEYAIAGKNYPTPVIVATIFATIIGGASTIGVAEKFYTAGIIFFVVCLGAVFRDVITAKWIIPKMGDLSGHISPGDIMGEYYGKPGQLITGIAVLIRCSISVGIQVSAMGFLGNYFFGIPYYVSAIVATLTVILYSTFGGIRSVTITDVIQFGILIVAIPMVCNFGVNEVGGLKAIADTIPSAHMALPSDLPTNLKYLSLAFVFLIPDLDPAVLQRLLMGRDIKQGQSAIMISAFACIPLYAVAGIIGLVALSLDPNLQPSLALPFLLNNVLPVGMKGFAVAGILAVVMSTADSYLNIGGISLIHDVIRPLKKEPLSDENELVLMQGATFFLGIGAMCCALILPNVFGLAVACLSLWKPLIFPALLFGVLGLTTDRKTFFRGILAGLLSQIVWTTFFKSWLILDGIIIGTAVHFAVILWPHLAAKISRSKCSNIEAAN